MKPLHDCRLYTFVDLAYLHGRDPADVAHQLCGGGSDLVQLRAKDTSPEHIRRIAETLLPITEKSGVWLVINDHPQVARDIGAPMVHLGQEDFFDAGHTQAAQVTAGGYVENELPLLPRREERAGERRDFIRTQSDTLTTIQSTPSPRPRAGEREPEARKRLLLGLSTHAPEQAERALRAGPDYLAIGPVFATPTKPGRPAATLDYVRWAAQHVSIPWFAIGGITLQNLEEVLAAGATRICIVSAILNAPDIGKACRAFKDRLASAARKIADSQ